MNKECAGNNGQQQKKLFRNFDALGKKGCRMPWGCCPFGVKAGVGVGWHQVTPLMGTGKHLQPLSFWPAVGCGYQTR